MLLLLLSKDGWHCGDRTVLQKSTVPQSRSIVSGDPLLFSKASSLPVHKSKPPALCSDHRLSIYNRYLWLCGKPELSPAEDFIPPEVVCGQ